MIPRGCRIFCRGTRPISVPLSQHRLQPRFGMQLSPRLSRYATIGVPSPSPSSSLTDRQSSPPKEEHKRNYKHVYSRAMMATSGVLIPSALTFTETFANAPYLPPIYSVSVGLLLGMHLGELKSSSDYDFSHPYYILAIGGASCISFAGAGIIRYALKEKKEEKRDVINK